MTEFDKIRNILIDYEDKGMKMEEALDAICGVCFARSIKIWDADIEQERILNEIDKIEHGSPERYWITMNEIRKIIAGMEG